MRELIHDFYIIESLKEDDIKDGQIFSDSLDSIKKVPIYECVESFKDLKKALENFEKSNYKYLLISCHGDEENLELSHEKINSYDLNDLNINFKQRRIFMSSCKGGSYIFAKYFIRNGAYSVVGTPNKLDQIIATGMWTTMLIIFERLSGTVLKYSEINKVSKLMTEVYQITLHYYSFIRNKKQMKEYIYLPGEKRNRKDYQL